ncbi:hypothetical protein D3C84_821410 [compost metagenome]
MTEIGFKVRHAVERLATQVELKTDGASVYRVPLRGLPPPARSNAVSGGVTLGPVRQTNGHLTCPNVARTGAAPGKSPGRQLLIQRFILTFKASQFSLRCGPLSLQECLDLKLVEAGIQLTHSGRHCVSNFECAWQATVQQFGP